MSSIKQLPSSCDYLIVGGGSAGAVLARRLADANIGDVVLLEAGKNDEGEADLLDLSRLDQQGDDTEWQFLAHPLVDKENQIHYSRAKMLGGCGNHNDCAFLVPPAEDFERWCELGATGWDAKSVWPYFQRIDSMVKTNVKPPISGTSQAFLDAGRQVGLQHIDFRDYAVAKNTTKVNGHESNYVSHIKEGVGVFPLNVDGRKRQSSSVAYLHPLTRHSSNLTVVCHIRVTKIMLEKGRVVGCCTDHGDISVNQETILAAGAIQTPQLLMLSGLGDPRELQKFDIPTEVELPGVGQNLMDHVAANVVLSLKSPVSPWELTCCEAMMMRSSKGSDSPPDLLYHFVLGGRNKYVGRQDNPEHSVKISPNVARPKSRGRVGLASTDIRDQPNINLSFFSDHDGHDLKVLLQGLHYARALAETPALSSLTEFEFLPGPHVTTDDELCEYIKETCETVYHPSGTCRMGSVRDPKTVVSPDLKVIGVSGLRVCDASVFPEMVTVNINNSVMMVAEKAADLIIREGGSQS